MSKHFDKNGHKGQFKVSGNRTIDQMFSWNHGFDDDEDYDDKKKKHHDDDYDKHNHDKHDNHHDNNHQNNSQQNGNHGNQGNGNQNQNKNNGNQNNQNKGPRWNNAVCKILRNDKYYDRDDTLNLLIHKDGLVDMIKDLKENHKKPGSVDVSYIQRLLADITFASALPEALETLFSRKLDNEDIFSHKELGYLMNEILVFLSNSFKPNSNFQQIYDPDIQKKIRDVYSDILYVYSKKKFKKLCEEIKNMSKDTAKQICVITAGNNPASSIYNLISYLYREADKEDFFNVNQKSLMKLFKICYKSDNMNNVIKYLMLEKAKKVENMSEKAVDVYVNIDMVIRDYLESLEKNDLYNLIKEYIGERKHQEKGGYIPRRFNKNDINPDDYPKLVKALSSIETKDFSIITYLKR